MSREVVNIVIAGHGGQGVVTASDIVAEAALRAGFDVKKSELHGMSQRGGSVASDVRFGREILSPMVPEGEADFLVVLAAEEVEASRHRLRPKGVLITPEAVSEHELPNRRSLNVALLGALSAWLNIPEAPWLEAVLAALPKKLHDANLRAFEIGRATDSGKLRGERI